MIKYLPLIILAIIVFITFIILFRGKKVTLGDEVVAYIIEKLKENGYTDLDLEKMVIRLDDQRRIFECIFLSIYDYQGDYVEEKVFPDPITGEIPPLDVWYKIADRLIKNFLNKNKKNV